MREVWLQSNRRALAVGMIPPLVLIGLGVLGARYASAPWNWLSVFVTVFGCAAVGLLAINMWLPRLAYQDRHLLVYLGGAVPVRVPIEVVEVFFLGQSASMMPRSVVDGERGESEASAIIVRLAESAEAWHRRPVKPSFGQWCDGYITIRGTWCEPLSGQVVLQLNRRLVQAHREGRADNPVDVGSPRGEP